MTSSRLAARTLTELDGALSELSLDPTSTAR
jgi:hypothetical protein